MSATSKVGLETGAIAHVNFRVRCEKLGHGEDVFLMEEGDTKMQKVRPETSVSSPRDWTRDTSLRLFARVCWY
jgi:hypothetical protein